MADLQTKVWCYIEGQRDTFSVSTLYNGTVEKLKQQIYNQDVHFFTHRKLDASRLTLTKVRYIMVPMRTLIYRMAAG